jgi:hypothetical protein
MFYSFQYMFFFFTSVVKFIYENFILFYAIVNGIVFLISFADRSIISV